MHYPYLQMQGVVTQTKEDLLQTQRIPEGEKEQPK